MRVSVYVSSNENIDFFHYKVVCLFMITIQINLKSIFEMILTSLSSSIPPLVLWYCDVNSLKWKDFEPKKSFSVCLWSVKYHFVLKESFFSCCYPNKLFFCIMTFPRACVRDIFFENIPILFYLEMFEGIVSEVCAISIGFFVL